MITHLQAPSINYLFTIIAIIFCGILYPILVFKLDGQKIKLNVLIKFILITIVTHLLPVHLLNYLSITGLHQHNVIWECIFILQMPLAFLAYCYFTKRILQKPAYESIILSRYLFLTLTLLTVLLIIFRFIFLETSTDYTILLTQLTVIPLIFTGYLTLKKLIFDFKELIADSNLQTNYSQNPFHHYLIANFLFVFIYHALGFLATCWITGTDTYMLYKSAVVFFVLLLTYILLYLWDKTRILVSTVRTKNICISSLTDSIEKTSEVRHNIGNIIQVYEGYIKLKKYGELEKYHQQTLKTLAVNGNVVAGLQIFKNNEVMMNLISDKLQQAEKAGIDFSYYVNNTKNIPALQAPGLNRIINFLLDNAIKETINTSLKIVQINIEKRYDYVLVTISHTIKDQRQAMKILNRLYGLKEPSQATYYLKQLLKTIPPEEDYLIEYNYSSNRFTTHIILACT